MLHETIAIIGSIVSIILLFVVIIQTSLLKKQITEASRETHLANSPYIMPRVVKTTGKPILHLKNVGRGSAVNIHIKIKSNTGEGLHNVLRFSFLPEDLTHNTYVNLEKFSRVSIEGSYFDISETQHKIKKVFTYPPNSGGEEGFSD